MIEDMSTAMSSEKFQQYQNQKILTATPAMLVFMLYEKAIGCLKETVSAIRAGEIESRWKANKRAMEIIEHLRLTLNTDEGGEIAANLDGIYGYLLRELPNVDLKNDPTPAERGIKLLDPLRESWRLIAEQGDGAAQLAAQAARNTANSLTARPPATPSSSAAPSADRNADRTSKAKTVAPSNVPGGITISA